MEQSARFAGVQSNPVVEAKRTGRAASFASLLTRSGHLACEANGSSKQGTHDPELVTSDMIAIDPT